MKLTPTKAATAALVLALGLAAIWPQTVLVLQNSRGGPWIFARQVHPGDTFSTRYTHSVKHKPVWDIYRVDAHHRIIQCETIFPGSGFGLPCQTESGEVYTLRADGNGQISNMQRLIVPPLLLRVERAYDNIFTFDGSESLNLSQTIGDGVVNLRIRRVASIQWAAALIRRRICLKN